MKKRMTLICLAFLLLTCAALADREITDDRFRVTLAGDWMTDRSTFTDGYREISHYSEKYGSGLTVSQTCFRNDVSFRDIWENYAAYAVYPCTDSKRSSLRLFGLSAMLIASETDGGHVYDFFFMGDDCIEQLTVMSREPKTMEEIQSVVLAVEPIRQAASSGSFARICNAEIRYDGASVRKSGGTYILELKFTWHNLSDDPVPFPVAFTVEVYQDGVQLQEDLFGEKDTGTKLMRGGEVTVTTSFRLRNRTGGLTVIVDSLQNVARRWDPYKFSLSFSR